jgi:hypothetical protein
MFMRVNSTCAHQVRWIAPSSGHRIGLGDAHTEHQRSGRRRIRKPDFLIDSIFVDGARSGDADSCGALQTPSLC